MRISAHQLLTRLSMRVKEKPGMSILRVLLSSVLHFCQPAFGNSSYDILTSATLKRCCQPEEYPVELSSRAFRDLYC